MEYELETGTIRANLGGKYLQSGQAIISNIMRPVLQSFILPFYGLKTLHGALLTKDGQTLFLSGPGGAGKTTTALAFADAGYEILSDDGPLAQEIIEADDVRAELQVTRDLAQCN